MSVCIKKERSPKLLQKKRKAITLRRTVVLSNSPRSPRDEHSVLLQEAVQTRENLTGHSKASLTQGKTVRANFGEENQYGRQVSQKQEATFPEERRTRRRRRR